MIKKILNKKKTKFCGYNQKDPLYMSDLKMHSRILSRNKNEIYFVQQFYLSKKFLPNRFQQSSLLFV